MSDLFLRAAKRLGQLKSMDENDRDAYTYGPFGPKTGGPSKPAPDATSGDDTDAAAQAKYHRGMADYYSKKAGSDTVPHTTSANDAEKAELGPDVDMKP